MKKCFQLVLLLTIFASTSVHSQELTREELQPLFGALGMESWSDAFKISNELIAKYPDDSTDDLRSLVNYASITAAAGLVAEQKMTYPQLKKHMVQFIGRRLVMAAHPTVIDTGDFNTGNNANVLRKTDTGVVGFVCHTNKQGSNILSFEHYVFADVSDPETYRGTSTRWSGILDAVEYNPVGDVIWVTRLHLKNAHLHVWHPIK
jgi:hypothetical protein